MKVDAELRIVTVSSERTESVAEGWMKLDETVSFGYDENDYSLCVQLKNGVATVTRSGTASYTFSLDKSRITRADFEEFSTEVRTDMLLYKISDRRLEFAARYSLGNTKDTTEIIIKAIQV